MIRHRLVLLLISCCFQEAWAQFPNIRLDDAVTNPAIVINPKNPLNIVAASVKDNVYVTVDGGKTWTTQKLASPFGIYGPPALVADSKGNLYLFHLSDPTGEGWQNEKSLDAIVCQVSSDGGKVWDGGNALGFNAPKDQSKPWATVDSKGNIHVAWTQFDKYASADSTCQSVIMLSSSSNGKKWTKPVQISSIPGDCIDNDNTVGGSAPAMSDDKKLYMAWSNRNKLFLDRSFDGGGMWLSNDIVIGDHPGGWSMHIPGHDRSSGLPSLVVDRSKAQSKGLLYLAWADQRNGKDNTDIWFMRSNNFGDYWSTPLRVGDEGNDKHQYAPRMVVDQTSGYLYILYYDRSNYDDTQTDVYLAYSVDAGSTFKTVKVSETPFVPDDAASISADNLNISAHKGIIAPVWTRVDQGKTSVWTAVIKHSDLPK